jgi:hypothetical protein
MVDGIEDADAAIEIKLTPAMVRCGVPADRRDGMTEVQILSPRPL